MKAKFSVESSIKETEKVLDNFLKGVVITRYIIAPKKEENLYLVGYKDYEKLEKENQGLKKQLDDYKSRYITGLNSQLSEDVKPDGEDFYLAEIEGKSNDYNKLVAQQRKFIKYLEEKIKELNPKNLSTAEYYQNNPDLKVFRLYTYQETLSKYKEIIGDKDE